MADNRFDLNHCELGGRLAFDPDQRTTANGKLMTTAKIVVTETYNGVEKKLWVRLIVWGDRGEALLRFRKGEAIKARGKVGLNEWTNKDGEKKVDLELMVWEVVASNEQFAPRERKGGGAPTRDPDQQPLPERPPPQDGPPPPGDDDIPF